MQKCFSPAPFKDVDKSQIKGNIDNKDVIISTVCIENFSNNFFIIFDIYSFQSIVY